MRKHSVARSNFTWLHSMWLPFPYGSPAQCEGLPYRKWTAQNAANFSGSSYVAPNSVRDLVEINQRPIGDRYYDGKSGKICWTPKRGSHFHMGVQQHLKDSAVEKRKAQNAANRSRSALTWPLRHRTPKLPAFGSSFSVDFAGVSLLCCIP